MDIDVIAFAHLLPSCHFDGDAHILPDTRSIQCQNPLLGIELIKGRSTPALRLVEVKMRGGASGEAPLELS